MGQILQDRVHGNYFWVCNVAGCRERHNELGPVEENLFDKSAPPPPDATLLIRTEAPKPVKILTRKSKAQCDHKCDFLYRMERLAPMIVF